VNLPGRYYSGAIVVTAPTAVEAREAAEVNVTNLRAYATSIDLACGDPVTVAEYERQLWPEGSSS
jgi:hypothetical protein